MKRNLLLCFILAGAMIRAQDLHFSQYNENPSLLNPALTGAVAPVRGSLNYRDQWRSVNSRFQTMGASFEVRTKPGRSRKNGRYGNTRKGIGRWGTGVAVYRDKAGDGLMGSTIGSFNLATFLGLGKRNAISAGFQASIVQHQVEYSQLVFPNQFGGSGYDNSLSSGEKFAHERFTHADYAAGFLWMYGQDEKTFITHREIKARLGFSMYHFMEPTREFVRNSTNLVSKKYVSHGDLLISIAAGHAALAPSYLVQMQDDHMEFLAGMMFRFNTVGSGTRYTGYNKRTTFGFGGFYRNSDAVIISLLLEMQERFAFGLSYDVNISALSGASHSRGGVELSVRYTSGSF